MACMLGLKQQGDDFKKSLGCLLRGKAIKRRSAFRTGTVDVMAKSRIGRCTFWGDAQITHHGMYRPSVVHLK